MKGAFAAGVLLLFAASAGADDAAARKMLKDLEGSYTPVSMTRGGEADSDEDKKSISFHIQGDTFTVRFAKNKDHVATIVLDPSQKPVAIDLTPKEGPEKDKRMLGIIKIEKDTVTLCWTDEDDKPVRPKDFSSTKENKNFLIVMKKTR